MRYALIFHYLFDLVCSTNYEVEEEDIKMYVISRTWEKKIYYYDEDNKERSVKVKSIEKSITLCVHLFDKHRKRF
jgi:hypothetical protein